MDVGVTLPTHSRDHHQRDLGAADITGTVKNHLTFALMTVPLGAAALGDEPLPPMCRTQARPRVGLFLCALPLLKLTPTPSF